MLVKHAELNHKLYSEQVAIKHTVETNNLISRAYAEGDNTLDWLDTIDDKGTIATIPVINRAEDEVLSTDFTLDNSTVVENQIEDNDSSEHKPFEYEVVGGDTVSSIALKYHLELNTILWANGMAKNTRIRPGQRLTLLPVDGVLHTVEKGQTISTIASLHQASANTVLAYNGMDKSSKIHVGDTIIIPGGKLSTQSSPNKSTSRTAAKSSGAQTSGGVGKLVWPTTTRYLTQRYSARHRGIDIANGGTPPIFAAHSGVVEYAGNQGAWGNTVVVRGDDGLVTRYSHASEIYVEAGSRVEAGQTIAQVGNTGRVHGITGLHIDFRVYKNGVAVNPLAYLK